MHLAQANSHNRLDSTPSRTEPLISVKRRLCRQGQVALYDSLEQRERERARTTQRRGEIQYEHVIKGTAATADHAAAATFTACFPLLTAAYRLKLCIILTSAPGSADAALQVKHRLQHIQLLKSHHTSDTGFPGSRNKGCSTKGLTHPTSIA